jgi:hypothetical protein
MPDQYALRHDGRVWIYLGAVGSDRTPYMDGEPMQAGAVRGWWWAAAPSHDGPPFPTVEVERPSRQVTVGYHRTLPVDDPRYPETLTVEEYRARTDDDEGGYDAKVDALYEAVREAEPSVRERVPGPWLWLDGEPPPDDGLDWKATLPFELRARREYLHLFPGHLDGFRDAVKEALEAIPGARVYTASGTFDVSLTVTLPKHAPLPQWARPPDLSHLTARERRQRLARESEVVERITRQLRIPVPSRVEGADRADATVRWHERKAEIVAYVEAVVAAPCPNCGGHGYLEPTIDHEEATTA